VIDCLSAYLYDDSMKFFEQIDALVPFYNDCLSKIKTIDDMKKDLLLEFQAATTDYKVLNNLRHEKLRMI